MTGYDKSEDNSNDLDLSVIITQELVNYLRIEKKKGILPNPIPSFQRWHFAMVVDGLDITTVINNIKNIMDQTISNALASSNVCCVKSKIDQNSYKWVYINLWG